MCNTRFFLPEITHHTYVKSLKRRCTEFETAKPLSFATFLQIISRLQLFFMIRLFMRLLQYIDEACSPPTNQTLLPFCGPFCSKKELLSRFINNQMCQLASPSHRSSNSVLVGLHDATFFRCVWYFYFTSLLIRLSEIGSPVFALHALLLLLLYIQNMS